MRVPLPLVAARESEPAPDVVIAPPGDYRSAHPERAHCVIEVANTSDRNIEAPRYAASGFDERWLVNVPEEVVEVFREPSPDA